MDNETLQKLIYDQKYAAEVYQILSDKSIRDSVKKTMLNFKSDCLNNASYLNRFYQEENTSSYDPIVVLPNAALPYERLVFFMLDYEGVNNRVITLLSGSNEAGTPQFRFLLTFIASISSSHANILTHILFSLANRNLFGED